MVCDKTLATQLTTLPADRSPLTRLYSAQAALHLELCAGRPSPDLLRRVACVEALINAGGAR